MKTVTFNEILIPLFVGIFSFVFPMLINIVQHIDKKYNVRLVKKFVSEWQTLLFLGLLLLTLGWYMFLPCMPRRSCMLDAFPYICGGLVLSLLTVVYLIYTYNVPSRLFNHLLEVCPEETEKQKEWFKWLASILETNAVDNIQKLYDRMSGCHKKAETDPNSAKISSEVLHDGIITLHEALCKQEQSHISVNYGYRLLRIFFDNTKESNGNIRLLSSKTLHTLWICLHQQLDYNRDEWFMDYWKHAHQYYEERFPSGSSCNDEKTEEAEEIEKAKKEFEEFHLALGGLLLYKQKHNLLQQVTTYSSDVPARYPLVPEISGELISIFVDLFSNDSEEHRKYVLKYPFLNLNSGILIDNAFISSWIQRYLVFLFYRHFTHQYHDPNVDANADHFRVPVEDEGWKAIWRNASPILRKWMNDTDLQAVSARILGLSDREMTEVKEEFQIEIDRIDREVGTPA